MTRKSVHNWIFLAVVLMFSMVLCFFPSPEKKLNPNGKSFSAEIIETDNSMITEYGLLKYGSQTLKVVVREGAFKGRIFPAVNELRADMELDKFLVSGDIVTVVIKDNAIPEKTVLPVRDHERSLWTWVLFGSFCLLLIIFGSWTGIKALFSFVFSCLVIYKAVIPLVLKGFSASWTIFACVLILTAVIIFLVAGITRKGVAAFAGAAGGVFAGLAMANIFRILLNVNGASMPYVQALFFNGYEFIDIGDLFTGALILASSGAVMDLAMDIASAVEEVSAADRTMGFRELAASGIRVGRSVVGTMTTTLLLAYSGGYLSLLMMFTIQGTALRDIINNPLVAAEMIKTLIGSFSLVLVAPLTAFTSAWIMRCRTDKKSGNA